MSHGIYRTTSILDASERRLETVAHNLANVGTAGFKRRGSAFQSELTGRLGAQESVVAHRSTLDLSQGPLVRTGNTYDLALEGRGFFVVEGAAGEVYTRLGNFRNKGGVLVDPNDRPVAFERFTRPIDPIGEPVYVDRSGIVSQGQDEIGRLRIVDFARPELLSQDEQGYLHASPALKQVTYDAQVHQRTLEGSNVNAIAEMIELIEVQRAHERSSNTLNMIKTSYERLNRSR